MKTVIQIVVITLLFSSCQRTGFLTRKYTAGRYYETKKTLKHNIIFVDSTKSYAGTTIKIVEIKNYLDGNFNKEVINRKLQSIFSKKDTIVHLKRRGPNKEVVIKNNLPNVHVFLNENSKENKDDWNKIRKRNKATELTHIKISAVLALIFALVPFAGFIVALILKKRIKEYTATYGESLRTQKIMSNISLTLSIIPTIAAVLILLAVFTAFFLFAFSITPVVPAV